MAQAVLWLGRAASGTLRGSWRPGNQAVIPRPSSLFSSTPTSPLKSPLWGSLAVTSTGRPWRKERQGGQTVYPANG